MRRCLVGIGVGVLTISCGGNLTTPTAPTASPPPLAQIAGTWRGTFESSNYPPVTVFVNLNQTGSTVSGGWDGALGSATLAGNITGTVGASTFAGTITFAIGQTAGCSGPFSGSASTNSTINWSSPALTGTCNLGSGNPLAPRFVLQSCLTMNCVPSH